MDPFRQLLDPQASPEPGLLVSSNLDKICEELADQLERWRTNVDDCLTVLVTTRYPRVKNDTPLSLAFVSFDCLRCGKKALEYPEIIAHDCLYAYAKPAYDDIDAFDFEVLSFSKNTGRFPWSAKYLRLSSLVDLDARETSYWLVVCIRTLLLGRSWTAWIRDSLV